MAEAVSGNLPQTRRATEPTAEVPTRLHGVTCAGLLLMLLAIAHPVAEMGMYDDWSYVRTAELLARTGHIHYNGWATAMLGWQLYPAALLFRVFGVSFTAARVTTMLTAGGMLFLFHRIAARCGVTPRDAFLVTMLIGSSPLFLPLAATFMSDVAGCFAILVCLYCCIRGLQAQGSRAATGWIVAAALLNALGGTARQIAWLGVLVMVPCAVWILRRDRSVVVAGLLAIGIGDGLAVYWMRWFRHQPYAIPDTIWGRIPAPEAFVSLTFNTIKFGLTLGLVLLPLLMLFLAPAWRGKAGRGWIPGVVGVAALLLLYLLHEQELRYWLLPNMHQLGNFLAPEGLFTQWPINGRRPELLSYPVRSGLTLLTVAAIAAGIVVSRYRRVQERAEAGLADAKLRILVLPFLLASFAILVPRATFYHLFDRYALSPAVLLALLATRSYEQRVQPRFPVYAAGLVSVFAVYGVLVTHDLFAMYRGAHQAVLQAEASGVPKTSIDGGWEADGWTQLKLGDFVHQPLMQLRGEENLDLLPDRRPCPVYSWFLYPVLHVEYALAFASDACGGSTGMPPTTYQTWMPYRTVKVYVVRNELP